MIKSFYEKKENFIIANLLSFYIEKLKQDKIILSNKIEVANKEIIQNPQSILYLFKNEMDKIFSMLVKNFNHFSFSNICGYLQIIDVMEYQMNKEQLEALISCILKWKFSSIYLERTFESRNAPLDRLAAFFVRIFNRSEHFSEVHIDHLLDICKEPAPLKQDCVMMAIRKNVFKNQPKTSFKTHSNSSRMWIQLLFLYRANSIWSIFHRKKLI